MMPVLSVSGLKRTYRRGKTLFSAVSEVSFAVDAGDFVCITGESGSGKSTLLHMLTGLLKPDEGRVFFAGRDIAALPDDERSRLRNGRIGCIPQGYSLLNNFSVLDNVCLPRCLYDASRAARGEAMKKAESLLLRMGIAHLAAERPRNLSGGEQRRVAIARGLITDPALLVADEPTGDLDFKTTASILAFFSEISREGTAIVMVTHERDRVSAANRHFVMESGRLREQAAYAES
jgi:putative ABC transport system ATP-binding protein